MPSYPNIVNIDTTNPPKAAPSLADFAGIFVWSVSSTGYHNSKYRFERRELRLVQRHRDGVISIDAGVEFVKHADSRISKTLDRGF